MASQNGCTSQTKALPSWQDANYNVTSLFDNSGNVVERYVYDPYGRATVLDANWDTDADGTSDLGWVYLHQGGRHDASLKLSHFRYRDLHVDLGRWTRQDPLGHLNWGISMSWAAECARACRMRTPSVTHPCPSRLKSTYLVPRRSTAGLIAQA